MPIDLNGMQIFLASPGGLEDERKLVRRSIDSYNRRSGYRRGTAFIARGWEETAGGLGRPQALINPAVDECDLMIVILADRWGSPSSLGSDVTGTEEEFARALQLCGEESAHMRDILVLFRSLPADRLADPGPVLTRVLEFKTELERSKAILYGTFDNEDSLGEQVTAFLENWSGQIAPRMPIKLEIGSSTLLEEEKDPSDELGRAIELASCGRLVQAEQLFARAARNDSPDALTEFARFLRRQGRLSDSKRLNEKVVAELVSVERISTVDSGYLADSLANIGVMDRKAGDLQNSLRTLREAVEVAQNAPSPLPQELAYALDNLGHTQSQLGDAAQAELSFSAAEAVRRENGDSAGLLLSLLNRGWLHSRAADHEKAGECFFRAERLARDAGDDNALVRALAGKGNALLNDGKHKESIAPLQEALAMNENLNQSDGISITAGMLARAYVAAGEPDQAHAAARKSLEQSQRSGNHTGLSTAKWLLGQIERLKGNDVEANVLFDEAIEIANAADNQGLKQTIEADYGRGAST